MEMGFVDIVYIFFLAVSGTAHVSDHVSGLYDIPLLQPFGIRTVLPQVGIVVIPRSVKAFNPDPPAAVLIPAEGCDPTGFHADDGRAHLSHHVMPQMAAAVSIASCHPEVVKIRIGESFRNGRERF